MESLLESDTLHVCMLRLRHSATSLDVPFLPLPLPQTRLMGVRQGGFSLLGGVQL